MFCCCRFSFTPRSIFTNVRQFVIKKVHKAEHHPLENEEDREVLHFKVRKRQSTIPPDGDIISTCSYAEEGRQLSIASTTSASSITRSSDSQFFSTNSEETINSLNLSLYQQENISIKSDITTEKSDENKTSQIENVPVSGYLEFSVNFLEKEKKLVVHVDKATCLPAKGTKIYYDTFVKVTYLPSRKNIRVTRTIKSTLNPHFREDLYFHLTKLRNVNGRHLQLSVYDFDRQGRHDAIGHVILPLKEADLKDTTYHKLALTPKSLPIDNIGQLLLSFSYLESHDRLSVTVLRGRALRLDSYSAKFPTKAIDYFDTYVKITLMCGGAKVKTVKTAVVHGTHEPSYNQVFHFIVPMCFIEEASVVITVMVKGLLRQDAVVGRVVTGPYVYQHDQEITHWGLMIQERRAVVQWRMLYL